MMDDQRNKELLSTLVDGELQGAELDQAMRLAGDAQGQSDWQLYHLVGDVLRSPDLAHHSQHDLLTGLRAQLAKEPVRQSEWVHAAGLEQVAPAMAAATAVVGLRDPAANASVFRWKVAAGLATAAAVAAIGWHLVAGQLPTQQGAQLAQGQTIPVVALAADAGESVMLRDPRLDALMAEHQQYASRPALQSPADFLRNASFAAGNAAQR